MHLGSCTAQAIVGAYELLMNKETPKDFVDLSRLFVYYNARLIENKVTEDIGAYMRDGIKAVRQYGICAENLWPYYIDDFTMVPTEHAYLDAKKRNIKNYFRLQDLNDILDALTKDIPVVFSMKTYESFEDITPFDYVIPMPKKDQSPIGAHAMCFVGYDSVNKMLLVRNSFGRYWGNRGYCLMSYDYAKTELVDIWIFDIEINTT